MTDWRREAAIKVGDMTPRERLIQASIELRAWADSRECVLLGREHLAEVLADELDRLAEDPVHVHPKNRTCERTDEVLDNYRRRAIAAERALARGDRT